MYCTFCICLFVFFFNDTATTEIYTLSLHDARPICWRRTSEKPRCADGRPSSAEGDRKSTRLNSSHLVISYAVFCLKKKKQYTRIELNKINAARAITQITVITIT